VGGLNATQYSTTRLNDDARDDLVVFDRTTEKISTFVAIDNPSGTGIAWQYAPEYEAVFPTVRNWMLLVDYDGDGRKDFFTNESSGIRLLRNESANGRPVFRLITDAIITEGYSAKQPLYVSNTDTPAILDYDDDGDVDLLVGYAGTRTVGGYRAGLWQFENRGTTQNPAFVLVTTNYLGLTASLNLTNVLPAFADVDANGNSDLVVTGNGVEIRVLINAAPKGTAVRYNLATALRWPTPDGMTPGDLLTVTATASPTC